MTGRARDTAVTRRSLLVAALLVAPALTACSPARSADAERPDPLVALATAARADAALAAAVVAAAPKLAGRVGPLRDARTQHAVALEGEIARAAGATAGATTAATSGAAPAPAVTPVGASLGSLRKAVGASGTAAGLLVPTIDAHRVGLVAAVAACCTSYAAALA